jgi:hypothetical protein
MGTPTEQSWPGVSKLPHWDKVGMESLPHASTPLISHFSTLFTLFDPQVPQNKYRVNTLKKWLKDMAAKQGLSNNIKDESVALLEKMLCLDPAKRIDAFASFQVTHV